MSTSLIEWGEWCPCCEQCGLLIDPQVSVRRPGERGFRCLYCGLVTVLYSARWL